MELHLHIIGLLLMLLSLIHLDFPRRFVWTEELKKLSLMNRQMLQVHTFFIALTVAMMGALCFFFSELMIKDELGKVVSAGFALFWTIRFVFQLFVYSPQLWKGKPFETIIHILFTCFWVYMAVVFWSIAIA